MDPLDTTEIAAAIEAWASATVAGLNVYDERPESLWNKLPVAIAEVRQNREAPAPDDGTGMGAYQQTDSELFSIDLVVMVTPDPSWDAPKRLYALIDPLKDALRADATLGARVESCSRYFTVDYQRELLYDEDETPALPAILNLTVMQTRSKTR